MVIGPTRDRERTNATEAALMALYLEGSTSSHLFRGSKKTLYIVMRYSLPFATVSLTRDAT
jgi:hypothetical protein